jgi:hypothetical protein
MKKGLLLNYTEIQKPMVYIFHLIRSNTATPFFQTVQN